MTVFEEIKSGFESGQNIYDQTLIEYDYCKFTPIIRIGEKSAESDGVLALGDNLDYMTYLRLNNTATDIKLIYIDPPFFSKSKYNAVINIPVKGGEDVSLKHIVYDDRYERSLSCYISNLSARLMLMRDLLREDGLIFVHLDWHSSHYVKLIMDEIFGSENFVNEIIWQYKSGGSSDKHFSRKHDVILAYSKTPGVKLNIPVEKSYNRGFKPYNFDGVKEYQDEIGYYTLVKMKDVWAIDMVGRTSAERTGYATQKPGELASRIIEAASSPGDICADFFAGSGTLAYEAARLGRYFISCDNEEIALKTQMKRLATCNKTFDICAIDDSFIHKSCVKFAKNESGKFYIKSFVPQVDMGNIKLENRPNVQELIANDSRALIERIYIDLDYQISHTFCPDIQIQDIYSEFTLDDATNAMALILDSFGKYYYADFKNI